MSLKSNQLQEKVMHKQIAKLKCDIAADSYSRNSRIGPPQLDDLYRNLPYVTNSNVDPDMA